MGCQYTIDGKTYEAWEFDDYLRAMSPTAAARFMPGVNAVPDAPLTNKTDAWVSLAVKRVISMAAEGGYDKVAFVNGEQSADRYDLSKRVRQIIAAKEGGKHRVFARDTSGSNHDLGLLDASGLEETVGKSLAAKILQQTKDHDVYEGVDLKVGGEGMLSFYDKIVPSITKDVIRKIGGKGLESIRVNGAPAERAFNGLGDDKSKIKFRRYHNGSWLVEKGEGHVRAGEGRYWTGSEWSADRDMSRMFPTQQAAEASAIGTDQLGFAITPEMRRLAGEGLPMFSNRSSQVSRDADTIASMDADVRDNMTLWDAPGGPVAYNLYEARKMLPKPSAKLKRVTESNTFGLWQNYDYIANVDGTHFGVTKQEDPDDTEDESKFVYSFARLENPDDSRDTMTDQLDELFKEMRGSKSSGGGVQFSNRSEAWEAPEVTRFDNIVYTMQDKHVDTKRVIEAIEKESGSKVGEDQNVYLQEELFHGRTAKRVEQFSSDELKPLMQEMSKLGISMEDMEEYLHARHAKEANALIASREGGMEEGGSGMTDEQSDAYMANLGQEERAKFETAAKMVDDIVAKTRQMYADYGLESQEKVDGWKDMFQHYVPLQREQEGDSHGMGIGQGFSVKGKEVKGRTGSTRKVVDILANIAMQRERLIVRGEKNRVSQALVGLATANPNTDFWRIGPPPATKVYDPATNSIVDRADPMYKSRSNVLVAKMLDPDGQVKEVAVTFNEDNPRAMRMVSALKNLDAAKLEGLLGVSAKITRYFAAVNTQYNPVFGIVNMVRDVQHAMITLDRTPLAKKKTKVAKDTISAMAGIYKDMRAIRRGEHPASQWSTLWEEFQREGGQTGYREMFASSADRAEALQRELNPDGWLEGKYSHIFTANGMLKAPLATAKKTFDGLFGWLSDYNESMENAVRLSAYKSAIDQGMSKQEAASLAKNLTVNFNRKGQAGMQAGAVYAFFNAAVQGTANIGQTLFTMEGGDVKTIRLSPTGKKVVYGGMLLGTMQALAMAAAGFGDDDPPEFVRQRSLIIPIGGKAYVSIPMPQGFNVLPNLGRTLTEYALGGFKGTAKRSLDIVGMFADNFNPIGNAGLSMQTLAPTALDPLVALTENKDFTGKPIARVSRNKAIPGFTQYKDTATTMSKLLAEAINGVTGGNAYVAGALSPTPDQIDYLLDQAMGGVGREAAKVEMGAKALLNGEELPTHKTPLLGRFYGNAASQASEGNAFYANSEKLNALETEIKGMRKDGKNADAARLIQEHPEAALMNTANVIERQIQRLKREKRTLIDQSAPRATVREKEDQITAAMARLNRAMERVSAR